MGNDKNNLNLYNNDVLNQDKVIATQFRQLSPSDLNAILNLIEDQHGYIFADLQRFGIPRNLARVLIRNIVDFVLQNEGNYAGSLQQRLNQINRDMRRSNILFPILRIYDRNIVGRFNTFLRDIIEIALNYLEQFREL